MRIALLSLLVAAAPAKKPDVPVPDFWKPLRKPERGEWLYYHPEPGETFAEYKGAGPTRPTAERGTIYLQPWLTRPPADARLLERIATVLRAWFGREVKRLPPGPMPPRAYDARRRQHACFKLAARLVRRLPDDALLVLAVTDRDLSLADFDYALGWGSLEHRVAVMSTYRLGRGETRLRRTLGLALHEASHALSLRHCVFFPCLMNGAQTPAEADRRPMQLCPVCRAKLVWNLNDERQARYRRLALALREVGLPADARRTERAAEASRGLKSDN